MAKELSTQESLSYASGEYEIGNKHQEEEEAFISDASNSSSIKQNLGVTIFASRFANTIRGAQKMKSVDLPKLQKPEEPDFFAESEDN